MENIHTNTGYGAEQKSQMRPWENFKSEVTQEGHKYFLNFYTCHALFWVLSKRHEQSTQIPSKRAYSLVGKGEHICQAQLV